MQPTTTTPKLFPKKLAGLLAISLLLLSWKPLSSSFAGFMEELHLKLNQFNNITPASKVYLVSDKPMYEAGDVIWYSVFSRHGNNLANQAAQVTVQLINPQGTVEATQYPDHNSQDNNSKGNFNLKPDQPGGLYKLRAFINNGYQNDNNLAFEKEIQVQDVVLQRLKLTLDFDRKAYGPGDQVTAKVKAFSNSNQPLSGSVFQMIVSLNGKQVQQTKASIDKKGIGRIKFQLPDSLKSNDGHLNLIFDYEGLSESVAKTIPIVLNKVQLSFFPEGGELVNGLQSQLAFRALNEFNKPADVTGEIIDQTGKVAATFSSFHDGMGEFTFAPETGKTYQARITN